MSHPFTVIRAAEIEKWVADGSYERVLRRETVGAEPRIAAGMAACQRCGNPLGPRNRFCPACGAPVMEQPATAGGFCTACGYRLSGFEEFCPGCGQRRRP